MLLRTVNSRMSSARGFIILPITVNRQPVGFIYGDLDQSMPALKLEPPEIRHLEDLRTRVAKQRRKMDTGATGKNLM